MATQEFMHCSTVYAVWFGKPVVLLIAIRRHQILMPCSIIGESMSDVRICLNPGWEMNLPKQLILAVEEDAAGLSTQCAPSNKIN